MGLAITILPGGSTKTCAGRVRVAQAQIRHYTLSKRLPAGTDDLPDDVDLGDSPMAMQPTGPIMRYRNHHFWVDPIEAGSGRQNWGSVMFLGGIASPEGLKRCPYGRPGVMRHDVRPERNLVGCQIENARTGEPLSERDSVSKTSCSGSDGPDRAVRSNAMARASNGSWTEMPEPNRVWDNPDQGHLVRSSMSVCLVTGESRCSRI